MSAEAIELTQDERSDIEDAALLDAATSAAGLGRLGPRGQSVLPTMAALSTAWQADAACAGAPPEDADRMVSARSQDEATDLFETYCSTCPMVEQCLSDARALRGWGVAGGRVLLHGLLAADQLPAEAGGPAVEPRPVPTPAERLQRIRTVNALLAEGLSQTEVAEELGVSLNTVARDSRRLVEIEASPVEPPEATRRFRGQRVQPRRLTRAQRRAGRR